MADPILLADSVCGLWRPGQPERFAVCFPSPAAVGASGDPDTAREMASLVAQSAAEEDIPLLLTPAVNAASRVPEALRGFCFSDDPALNARLAAAWVDGLQESGAGAVLRYIPTDDPGDRAALDAVLTRTLPCALTADAAPGHDLPIVPEAGGSDDDFFNALMRAEPLRRRAEEFDWGMQHHQARKLARRAAVLLKNEGGLLPVRGRIRVAILGAAAKEGCFRAEGLPPVVCSETYAALQAVRSVWPVEYAEGCRADGAPDADLLNAAVQTARDSDLAFVFVHAESGRISAAQEDLILAVADAQKNTCVVLHTDRPLGLTWTDRVPALLVSLPGGQAAGAADIDILFGAVPPTGRLPFDLPPFATGDGISL